MKGGGQQPVASPETTFFFLGLMIVGLLAMAWFYHHAEIAQFFFTARSYELALLYEIFDPIYDFFVDLNISIPSPQYYQDLQTGLLSQDFTQIEFSDFKALMHDSGWAFVYPSGFLALVYSIYLIFFKSRTRLKATYTMKTLSDLESKNWPLIMPVLDKNLVKESLEEGQWRMADSPIKFAERYKMVKSVYERGNHIAKLDRARAEVVMAMQMGPLWTGLEPLPGYVRALFAIFAAKAENDSKGARALLNQIANSSKSGKLNFGGTQELLIKHVRSPKVGRAVGPHAYLLTVMASMLELARTDGVLASSEFLWLKLLDRRMWYMLNCVGRQTPFAEVSGPYSHWIVEKRLRRPLKVPMVGQAVNALDAALSEIIYNPGG
jgi:intracellular multiplication protein IcmP